MAATTKIDDSLLGAALTKGLASRDRAGVCPPLEKIAELVDGSLSGEERDRLMGHLALCDRCRATFLATAEVVNGQEGVAAQGTARRTGFLFPSALAAAAVLVIALTLQLRPLPADKVADAGKGATSAQARTAPPGETAGEAGASAAVQVARQHPLHAKHPAAGASPDGADLAGLLVQGGDAQLLAALAGRQEKTLGFAAKGEAESLAFRTGVAVINLELALLADDVDLAQLQAARLSPLLDTLAGDPGVAELERMVAGLEQGKLAYGMKGKAGKLERLVPDAQLPYLRLGAWVQGAMLAVQTGNMEYLGAGVPRYFSGKVAGAAFPQQAAAALLDLERKLKKPRSLDPELIEKDLLVLLEAF